MAQGYKLVKRYSKPGDKTSEKKVYAVAKSTGTTSLNKLCKMISARSTVSSADVKAVLDNLNFVIDMELHDGKIVQLGEFGNFRLSVGSEGVSEEKDFHAGLLRKPKILFTPGASLRETRQLAEFEKLTPEIVEVEIECDKEHAM